LNLKGVGVRKHVWAAVFVLTGLMLGEDGVAATIHVPGDQSAIQWGIDAASVGDTVVVAAGVYTWAGEGTGGDSAHGRSLIAMKSGIYLTSETGEADCVVIDAQQQGRVFKCDDVDDSASIVGFTITGGLVSGSDPEGDGGGMLCFNASPSVRNCIFLNNSARLGGGLYCYRSGPTVASCVFDNNTADSRGGGLYSYNVNPGYDAIPEVVDCVFIGNSTPHYGGGIHAAGNSGPRASRCVFIGNVAGNGGGGICSSGNPYIIPRIDSCTFSGNASALGAGVYVSSSGLVEVSSTIIAFNTGGEGVYCFLTDPTPSLSCCDIYGNEGGDWIGDIAGQLGGDGNINADPFFCDLQGGDVSIAEDSPCAPGNNSCGVLIGALPVACDQVAVQPTSWSRLKALY